MKTIIAIAAILQCTWAFGHGLLDDICEHEASFTPTKEEYKSNPTIYEHNLCALALYDKTKAATQLNIVSSMTRRYNNSNRYYLHPHDGDRTAFVQLLRPEMRDLAGGESFSFRHYQKASKETGEIVDWVDVIVNSGVGRPYFVVDRFSIRRAGFRYYDYVKHFGNGSESFPAQSFGSLKNFLQLRLSGCVLYYLTAYHSRENSTENLYVCPYQLPSEN